MRGLPVALVLALLSGCASDAPQDGGADLPSDAAANPAAPSEVTFFESDYQAQLDPIRLDVLVPPGAVDVRFEISQKTNTATAKATLTLSGCGSGTADWTLPGNIVIAVGNSWKEGALCGTADGGDQTLEIDPEIGPLEGTVRLIGVLALG